MQFAHASDQRLSGLRVRGDLAGRNVFAERLKMRVADGSYQGRSGSKKTLGTAGAHSCALDRRARRNEASLTHQGASARRHAGAQRGQNLRNRGMDFGGGVMWNSLEV
jgi:hypothetical protein